MSDHSVVDRRTVLRGVGTVTVAGLLAGCGGDGGDGGDGGGDTQTAAGTPTETAGGDGMDTPTETAQSTPTATGGMAEVESYLSDVSNFDGVTDMTGQDAVSVDVGAQGNGGAFAFAPAAISVDTGTTVTWEWTGEGASHNVVHEEGAFESELVMEAGHTFEHTFDSAGTYLYYCDPHRSLGMKGAVIVE